MEPACKYSFFNASCDSVMFAMISSTLFRYIIILNTTFLEMCGRCLKQLSDVPTERKRENTIPMSH